MRDELKIAGMGVFSKSHPTTPEELLFSGYNRLVALPRAVKRGMRWLRSQRHQPALEPATPDF